MNPELSNVHEWVEQARQALLRGDKNTAQALGEQAALAAPDLEDAWLILAASDSNPDDALAYAKKALELNPNSSRAHQAVAWTSGRLQQAHRKPESVEISSSGVARSSVRPALPKIESKKSPASSSGKRRLLLYGGALSLLACVAIVFVAWSAFSNLSFASIFDRAAAPPVAAQETLWASAEIAKPTVTPLNADPAMTQQIATAPPATETPLPVPATEAPLSSPVAPTPTPVTPPTAIPTDEPTNIPMATETPGILAMEIVADTPTSVYIPPTAAPPAAPTASAGTRGGVRWIDVDLTNQMVYAYEGDAIVNSFLVSTGTSMTPTVTGKFKIWIKLRKTDMSGPGYYLPDVPYTMYFYKGYGLHGTYWHSNFGTPMSHGCVNLSIPDAEWLYYWASEGTVVNVHY
ncbi:MAG: hypothetical protein HKUEN02_13170 [Anaerolineaceae bacterium]|nr:MAG: hypothetical protein HKUEN02_13170 [Anaerolineaceae bacterium]